MRTAFGYTGHPGAASDEHHGEAVPDKDRWEWMIWIVTAIAALMYGFHALALKEKSWREPPPSAEAAAPAAATAAARPVSTPAPDAARGLAPDAPGPDAAAPQAPDKKPFADTLYSASAYKLAEAGVISIISIFFVTFVAQARRLEDALEKGKETYERKADEILVGSRGAVEGLMDARAKLERLSSALERNTERVEIAVAAGRLNTVQQALIDSGVNRERTGRIRTRIVRSVEWLLTRIAEEHARLEMNGDQNRRLAEKVANAVFYAAYFRAQVLGFDRRRLLCGPHGDHWIRINTSFDHYATLVRELVLELGELEQAVRPGSGAHVHNYVYEYYTTFDGDPLLWLNPWACMECAEPEVRAHPQWLIFSEVFSRAQRLRGDDDRFYRWFLLKNQDRDKPQRSPDCRWAVGWVVQRTSSCSASPTASCQAHHAARWLSGTRTLGSATRACRLWGRCSSATRARLTRTLRSWSRSASRAEHPLSSAPGKSSVPASHPARTSLQSSPPSTTFTRG
ncbi:MAG TPA: hypothetical protein VFF65_06170 [Phycisphaerales bacterium]|nr:hypothetical protein [Phycisphaerales bacterium]